MVDPQAVLAEHVQAAMGAAFGPEHAHRDPVIRPSSARRLPGQRGAGPGQGGRPAAARGGRPHRGAPATSPHLCRDVAVSGPGFVNLTLHEDWLAGAGRRRRRRPAPGRAGASRDRSSRSTTPRPTWPRRCTSATCAPPSSATRSRGSWSSSATTSSGRTTSATGARRSACSSSTCSTSARTPPRRGCWPATPTRSTRRRGRSSTPSPDVADRARRRVVLLQGGDPDTLRLWQELVRALHAVLQHRLRRPSASR